MQWNNAATQSQLLRLICSFFAAQTLVADFSGRAHNTDLLLGLWLEHTEQYPRTAAGGHETQRSYIMITPHILNTGYIIWK